MEGMSLSDFYRKLKKLNNGFRIDIHRATFLRDKEYPTCGLYYGSKYIMGVPQYYVPKNSVAALNYIDLQKHYKPEVLKYIDKYGFIPDGSDIPEKILWRGQLAILHGLYKQGYLTANQIKNEFNISVDNRTEFPRNYIHRTF